MSKPPIKSRSKKEPENLSALRKGLAQALTVSKAELDARLRAARERKQKEGRKRYEQLA